LEEKMRSIFIISLSFVMASLFITNIYAQDETTTREVITKYLDSNHSDLSMLADDVVFINMATGEEHHGPEGVSQMLNFIYHVAFDAHAETKNLICTETNAVFEADFVGKHIGEFAGLPPTNKNVRVPLCVVYDLENDKIIKARVYFELPALLAQLNVK
jgi:predicted ester cyclase